ncbi:hypothetical protein ABTX15_21595 [Micromonospora sp. NPDC094482]|uniref:hypothetical protein n=1 Tax=unclassified Micromonospora TaxID=2617518 RepID=UPI00332F925B
MAGTGATSPPRYRQGFDQARGRPEKCRPRRRHEALLGIRELPAGRHRLEGQYRRRYGRDGALVEVTVLDAVPDILDLTNEIEGAVA